MTRDDFVLVSGEAEFYDREGVTTIALSIQIEEHSTVERVRSYYLTVDDNAVFLWRSETQRRPFSAKSKSEPTDMLSQRSWRAEK